MMAVERECSSCKTLQLVKRQLSQSEERERDFREKLRDAKSELANTARQLEVSKRMLSRVAADKAQLEVNAEQDKAVSRKLEARLAVATAAEGLQAKAARYKAQVRELRELHADTEARLMLAEEERITTAREVHVLKSALGLRSEVPDGALESHGKLLHALAQSQEESGALALALAEKESALGAGAAALRAAQGEVERLLGMRIELMAAGDEARGEAGEALELAGVYRREAAAARQETAHLQEQLQQVLSSQSRSEALLRSTEAALAAQQDKGRQLTDKLDKLERAGRLSAEALQSEVSHALERADIRMQEVRAEAAARHAALSEQLAAAQQQLQIAQAQHAVDQRRYEDEEGERDAALSRVRAERAGAEREAAEARRETERLRAQLEAMADECEKCRHDVSVTEAVARAAREEAAAAEQALREERDGAAALRTRVEAVDSRLRSALTASSQREEALQAEVAQMQSELSTASLVALRLQDELSAMRAQALDAAGEYAHADTQVEELHTTIQSLTASKAKVQSALLEQLSAFRDKLALVEEENRQLRLALGMMGQRPRPTAGAMPAAKDAPASNKALEHAVKAATAAAAAARIGVHRSPPGSAAKISAIRSSTPSSMLNRARDHSRALGYEDSEDEDEELKGHQAERVWEHTSTAVTRSAVARGPGSPMLSHLRTALRK